MKKLFLWSLTLGWAILIFYLTSIPNLKISDNTWVSFVISNGSHFLFFGIQAILLFSALHTLYSIRYTPYISAASIILTSLYGVLDELHQIYVPGRTADPMDWALDTLGAIIFLTVMTRIFTIKVDVKKTR